MSTQPTAIGKYQILSLLGEGSFGKVYRVLDPFLGIATALKVIPVDKPEELVANLREARFLEACKHKHVVEVRAADVATFDGKPCVIIDCELLTGSAQRLLESEFLTLQRATKMVSQALFGLEHLHNNGVLHCDIKPGNLLIDDKSVVKLSDFGLAVHLTSQARSPQMYTLHAAPEWCSRGNVSEVTDVYAMGVTLYRLLNNISDFSSLRPAQPEVSIIAGTFPNRSGFAPHVPAKLQRICKKAMNVDPNKRYQSASEFRGALDALKWEIEWRRVNPLVWEGQDDRHSYALKASTRNKAWCVEFLRNNRRQTQYCASGLNKEDQAILGLNELVASTSLRS